MKLFYSFWILLISNITFLFGGTSPCSATFVNFQSDYINYDASGNGFSGVSSEICLDNANPDYWLRFTMSGNSSVYILMESLATTQANIAIYQGNCNNPSQVLCYEGGTCLSDFPQVEITGLTSEEEYFIKIWSNTNLADFDMFLNTELPDYEVLPDIDFYCAANGSQFPDACYLYGSEGGGSSLAWLPIMVDFNESLNHRAELIFYETTGSTNDFGSTMVYSNFTPENCFEAGLQADIFTTFLTESFIIELNLEDETNHFCRVSVNGAVGLNVLEGPITVNGGNLRDGLVHNLDFKWAPNTNFYEIFLDGILLFSGTYDIINNCLGGSNLTTRGYTASTPTTNNKCCSFEGPEATTIISTQNIDLCAGESITVGGITYTDDALAVIESGNDLGCTSYDFSSIAFSSLLDSFLGEIIVCEDAPFIYEGLEYTETGSYEVILESSVNGCDSIVTFDILNISPIVQISGNQEVNCINDLVTLDSQNSTIDPAASISYLWEKDGVFYSDMPSISVGSGTYTLAITASLENVSCTSTETFTVFLIPSFIPQIINPSDTLCVGQCVTLELEPLSGDYSYLWSNDSTSSAISVCPVSTTNYSVTVTDNVDCQQIASTIVNTYPIGIFDNLDTTICIGDTLDLSAYSDYSISLSNEALGIVFNDELIALNNGVIDITLTDSNECVQPDTDLFVTILNCDPNCESKDTTVVAELCSGESLASYTMTGIYIDTFIIGNMCDSIVTLDLTVLPNSIDSLGIELCFGDSINGIDTSHFVLDTFQNVYGCDSIIYTAILVKDIIEVNISAEICEGDEYLGFTSSGNYTDTLTAIDGCDSILYIDLVVLPIAISSIDFSICNGDEYLGYTETGIYIDTLISHIGCDSIRTLDLSIIEIPMDTTLITICDGEMYNGYFESGIYSDTLFSQELGCDSILVLNLEVIEDQSDTLSVSICTGDMYEGYTEPGIYVDTTFTQENCPIFSVLQLETLDSIFIEIDTTICAMDSILGLEINSEGTYTFIDSSLMGCPVITNYNVQLAIPSDCLVNTKDAGSDLFRVYPNPSSNVLLIEAIDRCEVYIYNTRGELIYASKDKRLSHSIDLSSYISGMYVLKLNTTEIQIVKKIIKID